MSRTVKEATTTAFHYPDLESLKTHVLSFVSARKFAKHLKALRWKTPFKAVCQAWTKHWRRDEAGFGGACQHHNSPCLVNRPG